MTLERYCQKWNQGMTLKNSMEETTINDIERDNYEAQEEREPEQDYEPVV